MNINHRDKDGQCLLTIAMMKHDYDIAKILIQKPGINLDVIDQNGISFPFILLNYRNVELIEQIIKVFSKTKAKLLTLSALIMLVTRKGDTW